MAWNGRVGYKVHKHPLLGKWLNIKLHFITLTQKKKQTNKQRKTSTHSSRVAGGVKKRERQTDTHKHTDRIRHTSLTR